VDLIKESTTSEITISGMVINLVIITNTRIGMILYRKEVFHLYLTTIILRIILVWDIIRIKITIDLLKILERSLSRRKVEEEEQDGDYDPQQQEDDQYQMWNDQWDKDEEREYQEDNLETEEDDDEDENFCFLDEFDEAWYC
jgi:hypothetical protein